MIGENSVKKNWYYTTSKSNEKQFFDSYDDVIFAIICIFRYSAVINDVPDYYIYKDNKIYETIPGSDLYKMYVENGGTVIEQEKKLDEVIEECEELRMPKAPTLKELLDNINKLNSLLDGGRF